MNNIIIAGLFWWMVAASNDIQQVVKEVDVTNDWDEAIALYKKGEIVQEYRDGYDAFNVIYLTNYCSSISNTMIFYAGGGTMGGYVREIHECPRCTKQHFDEYPKLNTVTKGIQKKIECNLFRGTNQLTRTIRYTHPYKKIETVKTEKVVIQTNKITLITPLKEVLKTEKVWVETK